MLKMKVLACLDILKTILTSTLLVTVTLNCVADGQCYEPIELDTMKFTPHYDKMPVVGRDVSNCFLACIQSGFARGGHIQIQKMNDVCLCEENTGNVFPY